MTANDTIVTRFAPSPTGHLHIGSARTALFCHLLARRYGGRFLLRIEDTDRVRHVEGAVEQIVEDLRWLGIDWDEGILVGGPNGPYEQSQRLDVYRGFIDRLIAEGHAYFAFETGEELDAQRAAAEAEKRNYRYARPDPLPSATDVEAAQAAGRPVVVRFIAGSGDVTVVDEVYGEVTVPAEQQEDFIIRKGDGWPTYHMANVVDDALMGVNFILRGQEFLGQTWRHKLLREALGYPEPRYAHLPLILDMKGRKLSKRDGDVDIHSFRRAGYLPEALVNFIALLGWSPGGQREKFSPEELREAFSVDRLGKTNAKFDREKLLAFNTDALAVADEERVLECFRDYLSLNATDLPDNEATLRHLIRANQGFRTFADLQEKCGVLFAPDDAFSYDPKAYEKILTKGDAQGLAVLEELRGKLAGLDWTNESLEAFFHEYCEAKGLGMGKVAQPIRVAVTGGTISPNIFDTLTLLGKERTLARIDRCLASRGG